MLRVDRGIITVKRKTSSVAVGLGQTYCESSFWGTGYLVIKYIITLGEMLVTSWAIRNH